MKPPIRSVLILFASIVFACNVSAQVDEICAESGAIPSLDSPKLSSPYVYGRIALSGFAPGSKLPRVTVVFSDRDQPEKRLTLSESGNYCFKRANGSGATLVVEVNGVEFARKSISSFGPAQQREDFEIYSTQSPKLGPPGVVSAKFSRPINPNTVELYKNTVEAEKSRNMGRAIGYLKEIVSIDPADFIAWAKLGSLYFEQNLLVEAEAAFRKSLELKVEYTPAWINVGKMRVAQKRFEAAIEIFKHAASLEPTSARAFQLLGEAYLQAKKGTLGVQSLNEAIRLDPIGMAECHLLLARLYDLAGAKPLASREYKLFLTKVPDHPDKKRFEKYIMDNPE